MKWMGAVVVVMSVTVAAAQVPAGGTSWTRGILKDEMTGGALGSSYCLSSTNTVTFGFPYGGPHAAKLCVRVRTDGSTSVLTSVPAQIMHRNGARFITGNEAQTTEVSLEESSDSDASVAFLDLSGARIADAKLMKLELTFFQEGIRVFTFKPMAPLTSVASYRREAIEGAAAQERLRRARTNTTELISRLCEDPKSVAEHSIVSLEMFLSDVSSADARSILSPYALCIESIAAWSPNTKRAQDLKARLAIAPAR